MQISRQGLWYDADGKPTGNIHTLKEGKAGALPMEPHQIFRMENKHWISVTDNLPELGRWFSQNDIMELVSRGYEIEQIDVLRWRKFHFADYGYAHAVYCREDMVCMKAIDPMSPFLEAGIKTFDA